MMTEDLPLDPGEKLIWSGRPAPLAYALRKGGATFLFGLAFFSFSIFWVTGAAKQGGLISEQYGLPFWLFGVPFVIVGASMVLSPLWHFWRGQRVTYALTSTRALIAITSPFAKRFSMPLGEIRFVDVRPASGGSGSIYFKETATADGEGGTKTSREGFVAVQEVDRVEQLLRRAIEQSAAATLRRAAS